MPEAGYADIIPREEILSFEEIVRVAEAAAKLGIRKIRLTGGEPLVRHNVVDLISKIHEIEGIEEIGITTNGILLPEMGGGSEKGRRDAGQYQHRYHGSGKI